MYTEKTYKDVVDEIRNLNWSCLNSEELQRLMFLSHTSAVEFGEALRIALKIYPDSHNLQEMAEGELEATNLSFEEYDQAGDHAEFLKYFLDKNNIKGDVELERFASIYLEKCRSFDDKTRAMTIFSREEELSGIFQRILKAKDWAALGLPAFKYYLESHIALDSQEGGHAELTKEFHLDESLKPFYEARLEMYKAIPALFKD
jgi:hypothetical protein